MGKADEENYEVLIDAQNGVRDYIVVVHFYPEHDSFGLTPDLCLCMNISISISMAMNLMYCFSLHLHQASAVLLEVGVESWTSCLV